MEPLHPGDPRRIGPYELEARLGAGGMGQVFLGASPGARSVAVKVIRAEHAEDARFRRRFAREVEAARKVGGFHTAQVVDADSEADAPWLVTAFIPGPSLREVVAERGPLDPDDVRALAAGLAEGLAAIHACGLVHRDLKPGNVIMAADGPRIIDFGIALATDATVLTSHNVVVGTYAYMSPRLRPRLRRDRRRPLRRHVHPGDRPPRPARGTGPVRTARRPGQHDRRVPGQGSRAAPARRSRCRSPR
ncbi:hypothetical protein GCM10023178_38480 [Actinomadura luteofluorescens]